MRRVDCSDFRFPVVIYTSKVRVLRRPVESAQYLSIKYTERLPKLASNTVGSVGDSYDNAAVETFFKTNKAEMIWRRTWQTRRQAETAIFQCINGFYNPRRRYSALGGKSPLAFERQVA